MRNLHPHLPASSANSTIRQPPEPRLVVFFFIIHTHNRVLAPCTTSGLLSYYAPILQPSSKTSTSTIDTKRIRKLSKANTHRLKSESY